MSNGVKEITVLAVSIQSLVSLDIPAYIGILLLVFRHSKKPKVCLVSAAYPTGTLGISKKGQTKLGHESCDVTAKLVSRIFLQSWMQ